jgi:hypothetical protein
MDDYADLALTVAGDFVTLGLMGWAGAEIAVCVNGTFDKRRAAIEPFNSPELKALSAENGRSFAALAQRVKALKQAVGPS